MLPPHADAAWMLQLIQLRLDKTTLKRLKDAIDKLDVSDEIKASFVSDIEPYINNASMTNMSRGEVKLFLGEFEELWMKYKVYVFRKKYVKEMNYVKTFIRGLLMQNYNKSIEGWQGDHVFERKSSYDVKQTNIQTPSDKLRGIFHRKPKEEQPQ